MFRPVRKVTATVERQATLFSRVQPSGSTELKSAVCNCILLVTGLLVI